MSITFVRIILFVLGTFCTFGGISFHLGYFRKPLVYWSTYSSGVYATAPLGLGLLLMGFMTWFPYPTKAGVWLMSFSFLFATIGFVLGATMPQFATPWWFRYLRETYDEWFIMAILMNDAAKNYAWWKENTKTKEGLVSWADEVRQKTRIEET